MFSILVVTRNSEKLLANTLSALVPAVIDGLLRRVVVVDQDSDDETKLVAEGAGCALCSEDQLTEALAGLRTDWLLMLLPGAILADGWEDAVRRHMDESRVPARFTLPQEERWGFIGKLFSSKPSLGSGLLVRLDVLKPFPSSVREMEDLPHRLKPVRLPQIIIPPQTTKGGA
ncbi:glycosyl transferase [Brucella rhizosphaerae]|uniref:Glycosyl transferase 2 family protein n=1 Tax=Brucella rhizosphaerae TaxID=571254 RepID=A0A256F5F9_9HYPH|nr:glycosyl transferase [Brucella rhizosphaerae]OYR10033.1 glycosyl transferase 2 family protein [Brucella rhizosphaerae]